MARGPLLTDDDRTAIRAAIAAGQQAPEIARALGRSHKTIRNEAVKMGLRFHRPPKPPPKRRGPGASPLSDLKRAAEDAAAIARDETDPKRKAQASRAAAVAMRALRTAQADTRLMNAEAKAARQNTAQTREDSLYGDSAASGDPQPVLAPEDAQRLLSAHARGRLSLTNEQIRSLGLLLGDQRKHGGGAEDEDLPWLADDAALARRMAEAHYEDRYGRTSE